MVSGEQLPQRLRLGARLRRVRAAGGEAAAGRGVDGRGQLAADEDLLALELSCRWMMVLPSVLLPQPLSPTTPIVCPAWKRRPRRVAARGGGKNIF